MTAVLAVLAACEPVPEGLTKEQAAEAARQYLIASGVAGVEEMHASSWTTIELYETPENKCLDRSEREIYVEFSKKFREVYREADKDPDHWAHLIERDQQKWREENPELVELSDEDKRQRKAALSGRRYYLLLYVPGDDALTGHIVCMYVDQRTGDVILPK